MPVTSDMELSVMKNRMAELKAQMTKESKEKRLSTAVEKERDHTSMVCYRGLRVCLVMSPATSSEEECLDVGRN